MRVNKNILSIFLSGLFIFGCGDSRQSADNPGDGDNRIRAAAKFLTSDLQVTDNTNDQGNPSIAYDPTNNKYLIVWEDSRNINTAGGTDIYGKLCDSASISSCTAAAEIIISNTGGSPAAGHQSQPKVAFDFINSKYLVVWTDSRNSGYSRIYGQYVNADGTLNGSNTALSPRTAITEDNVTAEYQSQSSPDIIYNETLQRFVLSWIDISDSDKDNQVTLQPGECNNSTTISYIPLPGADYYMVRTGEIDGSVALATASNTIDYSNFVNTPGITIGQGSITGAFQTHIKEAHPKLFYDKNTGDYFVVWQGRTSDVTFTKQYVAEEQTGTVSEYKSPATYGDGDGTWEAGESFTGTPGATISAISVFLSNGDSVDNTTTSGLGTSTVTVTLQSTSNAVGTTGNIRVDMTTDLGNTCTYYSTAWSSSDSDEGIQKIKLRKWTPSITTRNLAEDLSYGGNDSFNPSVVSDPNTSRVLLVWEEEVTNVVTGGSEKDIHGSLIDLANFHEYKNPEGVISDDVIKIANVQGDQTWPVVTFDNVNQRFMVAWEDARNQSANISNMDIYGQFVDPQGNLSGNNFPVTVSSGNQIAPALAFGDVDYRKFFVVWKDGREPSDANIYGQLWEYSVAPQLLIKDADGNPIYNQALDFGSVAVGETKDMGFKLCNDGNSQLTINSMATPDAPYSFTIPAPVNISPGVCYDMNVHFVPTAAGSYAGSTSNSFKTSIDSDGGSTTLYFSGSGTGIEALSVTTTSLSDGINGTAYSATLSAFGGVYPYTWSISSGSLPTGLSLNASTGEISGTPTASGTFSFTVKVTDNNSPTKSTATRSLSIKISSVNITNTSLKSWTQGVEYGNTPAETLAATGGTAPYTWSVSSGNFPTGLTLVAGTGAITGIPTASGIFTFTVMVTDSAGTPATATKEFTITINPSPSILTSSFPSGMIGTAYSQTISLAGGTSPITWSVSSGSLPPGLSLNSGTGVISGTLTAIGTYSFTIKATDSTGASTTKALSIQVSSEMVITTATLSDAIKDTQYSAALAATGGRAPYSWSVSEGALPGGLVLAEATGIISGTPTATGAFYFTIEVADADGRTATKTISITVYGMGWAGAAGSYISVSNSLIDFDMVTIGTSNPVALTISNLGSATMNITGITSPSSPFSVTSVGTFPLQLLPGTSYTIITTFSPSAEAVSNSSFTIQTDAVNGNQTINLQGVGETPSIRVQEGDGTDDGSLSFSSVLINRYQSVESQLVITNTGIIAYNVLNVSGFNDTFELTYATMKSEGETTYLGSSPTYPVKLEAGASLNLTIRFYPPYDSIPGDFTATLNVVTDVSNVLGTPAVTLTGTGLAPVLSVATSVDFGTVSASSTRTLTITNTGNADLTVDDIRAYWSGWWSDRFSLTTPSLPIVLAPGESTNLIIIFSPMADDGGLVFGDTLYIYSNHMNKSYSYATVEVKGAVSSTETISEGSSGSGTISASGDSNKKGCFIATAAYGSYLDPHVKVLRDFRDNVLLKTGAGTAFVKFYYRTSPPVADFISEHEALRTVTRWTLTPVVYAVKYPLCLGIVLLAGVFIGVRRSRLKIKEIGA